MTYLSKTNHGFVQRKVGGVTMDVVPAFLPYVDYLFCGYRSPLCFKVIRQGKKEDMQASYAKVCRAANLPYEKVTMTHIVHKDHVQWVQEDMAGRGVSRDEQMPPCDGLMTDIPGIPLASTHADCMPIAYYAPDKNIGCVVHAGWRGVLLGVHRQALDQLKSRGCDLHQLLIAIGPCIHQCCFEVGEEVSRAFFQAYGRGDWLERQDNRDHIDLLALVLRDFEQAGIAPLQITVDTRCTCCVENDLHSYRRDGNMAGTMVQIMCLRKK